MQEIVAANGQIMTGDMIDRWTKALDRDEWSEGEHNVGSVIKGRPPMSPEGSEVISHQDANSDETSGSVGSQNEDLSMSDYVRTAIAKSLIKTA